MHQAGTHWLKFMLASAMADHYGVPGPAYNHANDIIGGNKDPRRYAGVPYIKSSHSIAPLLLRNAAVLQRVGLPPCVLLIRDIRASLVSNFRKWQSRYGVSFSEYVRGDPSGHRFNSDIWWCFRFLNAWGHLVDLAGGRVHIVRYEDLRARPRVELAAAARHLRMPLSDACVDAAVNGAGKRAMAKRADPARPPGAINFAEDDPLATFDATDRDFVQTRCTRYLRYAFGYDYAAW